MSRVLSSLTILAMLTAGCVAPVRLATPSPVIQAPAPIASGLGRAQVSILWPRIGRQVQAIPGDAALARFDVFDASDSLIASASVERTPGIAVSTANLDLPEGSDRYVTVTIDAPGVPRVAVGRSQAFEVRRNQTVSVPITVQPIIKTFFGPLTAYNANGGTTSASGFARMWSLSVGPDDTIYYPDYSTHAIRAVQQDGTMRVVLGQVNETNGQLQGTPSTASPDNSGDGGPASQATCRTPHGLYVAPSGDIFFADTLTLSSPTLVRLRMIAATSGPRFGQDRQAGYVYTLRTFSTVFGAVGMVQDTDGSLLFTEQGTSTIWRMAPDGTVSVLIGNALGRADDGLTPAETSLSTPWGLMVDRQGNLFYSEYNGARVRMLCRETGTYFGLPMEAGKIYSVMDWQKVVTKPVSTAPKPRQMALDAAGALYFMDNQNNTVFRVELANVLTKVAGGTKSANNSLDVGDEGLAASASFNIPHGLAIDSHNRLYVGDTYNGRIRRIHL